VKLSGKYIVVIEDTHTILIFLKTWLEGMGAICKGAATASGGMALCETSSPDLVILDLGLPDHQGFDILPRLKKLRKNSPLPVIILTVCGDQESRDKAAELGADAYITKPFNPDDLIRIISDKLQGEGHRTIKSKAKA